MVGSFYYNRCNSKTKTCLSISSNPILGMGDFGDYINDEFSSDSGYFVHCAFLNSHSDDARRSGIPARGFISIWSLTKSDGTRLQPHSTIWYRFTSQG
jgi:hypothetical protein